MRKQNIYIPLAALALVLSAGGGIVAAAHADTLDAQASTQEIRQGDSKGGHVGKNGTRETILTGETATKVTAAALAAVPGGTVERVETDADGAVYEAHMTEADGSHVTVLFDANFAVTGTETGGSGGR